MEIQGARVADGTSPFDFPDWSYGLAPWGEAGTLEWSVKIPGERAAVRLTKHDVEVHDDGTVTVSPSILVHPLDTAVPPRPGWHGYLERGRFRSV